MEKTDFCVITKYIGSLITNAATLMAIKLCTVDLQQLNDKINDQQQIWLLINNCINTLLRKHKPVMSLYSSEYLIYMDKSHD